MREHTTAPAHDPAGRASRRAVLLLLFVCACGGESGGGGVEEGPACDTAFELREGRTLEGGFAVRGLGEDLLDASGVCPAARPLNGRELVVRFTAEEEGLYRFPTASVDGHFYRLAPDCATPVACAQTASPGRTLAFVLEAGEQVLLALDSASGGSVATVEVRVELPGGAATVPRVRSATVTAGEAGTGVMVVYENDPRRRMAALPSVVAVVSADGGEARVPLTAVRSLGGGLSGAAGAVTSAAPFAPGAAVTVRLVDERRDGSERWRTAAVEARVEAPARAKPGDFCADGLWTCGAAFPCGGTRLDNLADPGGVGACGE